MRDLLESPTYTVESRGRTHSEVRRLAMKLEDLVEQELADYLAGRELAAKQGVNAFDFHASVGDVAIWEGPYLAAVIKLDANREPRAIFPDEPLDDGDDQAGPEPLDEDQRRALEVLASFGRDEFFARVLLSGPYEVIWEAVQRLGTDAVKELRARKAL